MYDLSISIYVFVLFFQIKTANPGILANPHIFLIEPITIFRIWFYKIKIIRKKRVMKIHTKVNESQ